LRTCCRKKGGGGGGGRRRRRKKKKRNGRRTRRERKKIVIHLEGHKAVLVAELKLVELRNAIVRDSNARHVLLEVCVECGGVQTLEYHCMLYAKLYKN